MKILGIAMVTDWFFGWKSIGKIFIEIARGYNNGKNHIQT